MEICGASFLLIDQAIESQSDSAERRCRAQGALGAAVMSKKRHYLMRCYLCSQAERRGSFHD
ncbi:Hypothetical protein BN69_2367 [Methylocystis sp. SC2]|nr:Hypothetical protein BN69_2367 [Methylocystis sp. SC2]